MPLPAGGTALFAFVGSLAATSLDLWIGLRSMRATWRDVRAVRTLERGSPDRDRATGETIGSALISIIGLDLVACAVLVIAVALFEPARLADALIGSNSWLVWLGVGLAAPFVSGRALVGKTVARLFDQVYALPPSGAEQWIADPWRVRYRVRVDFLDHVFPIADERLSRADDVFRALESRLARRELSPASIRDSLVRYRDQRGDTFPGQICKHLDLAEAVVWQDMSEPEHVHWAQVAVFLCVNFGVTTPLRRHVESRPDRT